MIGAYVAVHACQLGLGSFRRPGPGLVFFLSALLFMALTAIDLVGTFFGESGKDKGSEEGPLWVEVRWQKVLIVLGGLSLYIYFFNVLGFIVSTFLLMMFLFKAVEPTKWWVAIASSIITIIFSYLVFEIWLQVPFPRGVLGI
jgi:hypothetical protein